MTKKLPKGVKPKVRRRRKDARPAELLAAGFAEFAEKGFLATRLEDVALRAGVAKGTIYLYYDSKEALFEAAVRARILPLLGEAGQIVDAFDGPADELLGHVFKAAYARIADPETQTLFRIMIGEGHRFPALLEFYHTEFISKMLALLRRIIERGIRRGEFRRGAATELPLVVMAPGLMAAIWQMTFSSLQPISLQHFEAAHLDLILNGLKRTKSNKA
jgi:AcrR family transcriptional regulator